MNFVKAWLNVGIKHPWFDPALPCILTIVWLSFRLPFVSESALRSDIYMTVAAIAGVCFTAATFTCGFLFSSSGELFKAVYSKFNKTIIRNWLTIMVSLVIVILLPVFSYLVDGLLPRLGFAMTIGALTWVSIIFFRVTFWITATIKIRTLQPNMTPTTETTVKDASEFFQD